MKDPRVDPLAAGDLWPPPPRVAPDFHARLQHRLRHEAVVAHRRRVARIMRVYWLGCVAVSLTIASQLDRAAVPVLVGLAVTVALGIGLFRLVPGPHRDRGVGELFLATIED